MKSEKEIRTKNTDNYRRIGLFILLISIISGLVVGLKYGSVFGFSIIGSGLGINLLFQITHSICYRLDLIINKK